MTNSFDFDQALTDLQAGKSLTGKDGILEIRVEISEIRDSHKNTD